MGVRMRQKVEREICTSVVDALLGAGYYIRIDNGDTADEDLVNSFDRTQILGAMFLTDEEYLFAMKDGRQFGWVRLIYGNDGWDVISDYTVNLEKLIGEGTATQKIVDEYAD